MVAAATTQRNRSPAPYGGKRGDKRNSNAHSKSHPLPAPISILSKPWQWRVQIFTTTTRARLTGVFHPVLGQKANCHRSPSGSAAILAHAGTAMHFPANAGLIFLTDELTNDRYLVDTGATLSIAPCTSNSSPSGPLLKGANGQPIPYWGFI